MLEEKKRDGPGSAIDGFYESKREWMGKRHFIFAFERYFTIVFGRLISNFIFFLQP